MSDFNISFKNTIIGNEGGYNPGTGERETYMGIDRGANPQWPGWKVIDEVKAQNPAINLANMNGLLAGNSNLQENIKSFYKACYWDTFRGDIIKDQQLANNLFDCSVNQGEGLANIIMQKACNAVVTSTKNSLPLLVVDGIIGIRTIDAINKLAPDALNEAINGERLASYTKDAGFNKWGAAWQKRLVNYIT